MRTFANFAFVLVCLVGARAPASAQDAATLPPLDEAYAQLDRLRAFGLVPRGHSGLAPYSRGRVAWLAQEARRLLTERPVESDARLDLVAILDRLEARLGVGSGRSLSGEAEVEAGGGSSPGVAIPYNILGGVNAVVNPLWAGRNGRAYPDRAGLAAAGRVDARLTRWLAVSTAYRAAVGRSSKGAVPGRPDALVEALSARVLMGRWAVQVGRDALWMRPSGYDGALLGANGPPLDLLRVSTDRPLGVGVLGAADLSFFVADMGPRDHFPHAKLFGALFALQPTASWDVTLALLNKQLGKGAPAASVAERLKDLSWAWDWFRTGEGEFSDKSLALSVGRRGGVLDVFGEMTLNDVDLSRPSHTFRGSAAYRLGIALPKLGAGHRHRIRGEVLQAGPMVYVHHQFLSGAAVDGFLQGALPGPESRSALLEYGFEAPGSRWRGTLRVTGETRSGDQWIESEINRDELVRVKRVPDESRLRGEGTFWCPLAGGRGGIEVRAGLERAWNFGHGEGVRRINRAVLARVSWAF